MHNRDTERLQAIATTLDADDFESPIFAHIFTAMADLLSQSRPCDAATVRSRLESQGINEALPADVINSTVVGLLTLGAIALHVGEYARQVVSTV